MSHATEQARARELKRLSRENLKSLEEENRIRTERLKHTIHVDVDHDYMLHLLRDVLPEDAERIEVILPSGSNGWKIRAMRRIE